MKKLNVVHTLEPAEIRRMVPPRRTDAHKGDSGHLLIVAGSRGLSGAAVLCAKGALRAGAGLVTVGIVESERPAVAAQLPEAMTLGLPETSEGVVSAKAFDSLASYIRRRTPTALAAGPGLGVDAPVRTLVLKLLSLKMRAVFDADALNNLRLADLRGSSGIVITPHPGELARLHRTSASEIQRRRQAACAETAATSGAVCVLKGHQTIVSNGASLRINPTGNPAMAAGGMGDVLTGMVGAALAQGAYPWEAACAGVYLHGLAADLAKVADRGLLASDVAAFIPHAIRTVISPQAGKDRS